MSDDVERTLGRIEGKLDLLLLNYAAHERLDNERFEAVNREVGKLGKWQGKIIGAGMAAGTIGGMLVHWFAHR